MKYAWKVTIFTTLKGNNSFKKREKKHTILESSWKCANDSLDTKQDIEVSTVYIKITYIKMYMPWLDLPTFLKVKDGNIYVYILPGYVEQEINI